MSVSGGQLLSLAMLAVLALALFSGLPVAVVLIGVGLAFGGLGLLSGDVRATDFGAIFYRLYGTLTESDELAYAAVPLLVFMGVMFQSAGLAEDLLLGLQRLAGRSRAALAVAVTAVGMLLAPLAGVVGASVSTLALLALPVMLRQGYRPSAAAGIVTAAGTLGVIVPPSVMLFFIADAIGMQVPAFFLAMMFPVLVLFGLYLLYAIVSEKPRPVSLAEREALPVSPGDALRRLLVPALLLAGMVGAVGLGWATLSEAAALGAAGAAVIAALARRLSLAMFDAVVRRTALVTAMIFFIYVGASLFSFIFHTLGGGKLLAAGLRAMDLGNAGTLAVILLLVFLLGFFLDWLELVLIVFPIFKPLLQELAFTGHVGPPYVVISWIAVLLALNLQTSFLTPPIGYALFLLKASAPAGVRMADVYRGVVPYVAMQLIVIALVLGFPSLATWLPDRVLDLTIPRPEKFNE